MTHSSDPIGCVYQGVAQIPDKFIINYRSSGDAPSPAIKFVGILEEDGTNIEIGTATLDAFVNDAIVVSPPFAPIIGYFYEITNVENMRELASIVMVTKHGAPLTQAFNS